MGRSGVLTWVRAEGRAGGSAGTLAGPEWTKGVGHGGARDEEPREVGDGRGQQDWEDPAERLDGQTDSWMEREGEMMKNRVNERMTDAT